MSASLEHLAWLHGVETRYDDVFGASRSPGQEALLAILRARGAQVEGLHDVQEAVRARRVELWRQAVAPVVVAFEGEPLVVELRCGAGASGTALLEARLEDGGDAHFELDLEALELIEAAALDGQRRVRRRMRIEAPLPVGYHRLTLHAGGESHPILLIRPPRRAPAPGAPASSSWGLFAPVYALRSQRDLGCGDLGELSDLLEWSATLGAGMVGTLPLLASFLDEPFEPSPYAPVSRLFWNELFVEPRRAGALLGQDAAAMLDTPEVQAEVRALRGLPLLDFRRAMALRRTVLEAMCDDLRRSGGLERLLAGGRLPRLDDYARFRATVERQRASWQAWPARQREGELREGDFDPRAAQYHAFVQVLAEEQIAALAARTRQLGPGLYLDLPLGVCGGGYDTWRERGAFAWGVAAGAPPDTFFVQGQTWGFPPLHPEGMGRGGHAYTSAFVRHHLRHAGMLRIDHVMGLHRLFWVPDGFQATEGTYVRYPAEELYAILCLEAERCGALLVGEDLGTVPDEVRPTMARRGLQRMHVLQFELSATEPLAVPAAPPESLAAVNTHDLPTFVSYWTGAEIDERVARGLTSPEEGGTEHAERRRLRDNVLGFLRREGLLESDDPLGVLSALLAFLGEGGAAEVLVNLEDLWLEPRPHNQPGVGTEHGSFRRRSAYTLEEAAGLPGVVETMARLSRSRRKASVHERGDDARAQAGHARSC